ncbi:MAG: hypothetical protein IIC55_07960 [Proteobacteria bacterium]|nr:hypothetical protein [Pseudomonadota bacterium]
MDTNETEKLKSQIRKAAALKFDASQTGQYDEAKKWAKVQTHLSEQLSGDGPIVGSGNRTF